MDARDGEQISGYVVHPKRINPPAPAVVLLHGRGTDASDIIAEGALLASRGAIAIVPDNAYVRLGPVQARGLAGLRQERRRRLASTSRRRPTASRGSAGASA
jgi:dienelactone hydrolase